MNEKFSYKNWAEFAQALCELRERFPEHAAELDRAAYDAGQKLDSCGDPNCTCRLTFENFRAISQKIARREYEFD